MWSRCGCICMLVRNSWQNFAFSHIRRFEPSRGDTGRKICSCWELSSWSPILINSAWDDFLSLMPMLRRALVRAIRFHGTFYTGKRIFQIPFMQFETADSNLWPAAGRWLRSIASDILCRESSHLLTALWAIGRRFEQRYLWQQTMIQVLKSRSCQLVSDDRKRRSNALILCYGRPSKLLSRGYSLRFASQLDL